MGRSRNVNKAAHGQKRSRYQEKRDAWDAGIEIPVIRPEKQVRPPAHGEWDVSGIVVSVSQNYHLFLRTAEGERVYIEEALLPEGTRAYRINDTLCCRTRRNHDGLYATRLLAPADIHN